MQTTCEGTKRYSRRNTNRNRIALEEMQEQERYERDERWQAIQRGTYTTASTDRRVARMNEIQCQGTLDRFPDEPFFHVYRGSVSADGQTETMWSQIAQLDGEVVVLFWDVDSRIRRMLVTARGQAFLEVGKAGRLECVPHTGKFFAAWQQLIHARQGRVL